VLLNVFHFCRLAYPEEYQDEEGRRWINWFRQRWWYKLAHVCRLWRNLILASPSRLNLNLVYTYGMSIADMLAHSPPLPLTICYHNIDRELTEEDESGILLALSSHRDRVRYVCFRMSNSNLKKFIPAMDDEFPILEQLHVDSRTEEVLSIPTTFQAPKLRRLILWAPVSPPIGSPLLTTAPGLVTLILDKIPEPAYLPPNYLLTWLSFMPQLEMLSICFYFPLPDSDTVEPEGQLLQTPNMTQLTLPDLDWFMFQGPSAYFDCLFGRISAPSLRVLDVFLFN
jgi:hypothetical protein